MASTTFGTSSLLLAVLHVRRNLLEKHVVRFTYGRRSCEAIVVCSSPATVAMKHSMLSIYAIIHFASRSYAFVALPLTGRSSIHMMRASRSCSAMSLSQEGPALERRRFVSGMAFAAATAAVGRATGLMETGVPPAQAASGGEGQLGDLESGPPEPMKVTEGEPLSSESARIQQKLAAQAKATGRSSSGTLTYSESMAAEGKKQAKMKAEKNDKARRRAAMCEELGRGC